MIRCHLARMMGERKMRIADVARETGLSRATVTLLYKETAQKVDLEAIRAAGHPTATALIVTNSDDLPEISVAANGDAAADKPVFKFKK